MSKLFIEILVPEEPAQVLADHFSDIASIFRNRAAKSGYEEISLTVIPIKKSTEGPIIKVSDPFLRSWNGELYKNIAMAWLESVKANNKTHVFGKPVIVFSTSIFE